MNRYTARTLVLMGLTIAAAVMAWGQAAAPRGTVNGAVTGSSGPVVGVKVVITSVVSAYTASAITDANGTVSFSDPPVGGVTLTVYDGSGNVLASAQGSLTSEGQVITVTVKTP
jgi:hypothetical protein